MRNICEYGGGSTFIMLSPILFGRQKQIICHFKADTYDIKPTWQSLSRVYDLKEERNNRTMFSKYHLIWLLLDFVTMVINRQSDCCTGCLKYAFESLVSLLLVEMNCFKLFKLFD